MASPGGEGVEGGRGGGCWWSLSYSANEFDGRSAARAAQGCSVSVGFDAHQL